MSEYSSHILRPWRPLILHALLALVLLIISHATSLAQPIDEISRGTLLLRGKGIATELPALRLGTDMNVTVSGQVARVRVTQAFRNTSDQWMEATYLYPLPDDAAVDSLKMIVGQRVIVGQIKKREEARAIYDHARESGQKAGLIEMHRPNLFRNNVANIAPEETVLVEVEYQAPVRLIDGDYTLRLPLVAGPRYIPPHAVISDTAAQDALNVSAPLAHPDLGETLNPVSITVKLDPGFAPTEVTSPYHPVTVENSEGNSRMVRLSQTTVPADRDFELHWRMSGDQPEVGVFKEVVDGATYLMATVTPPAAEPKTVAPREMIFVIDNSGSMGGTSMRAAKNSLLHALNTLRPQDSFNIIRFNDTMTKLFKQSVAATPEQLAHAKRFAMAIDADGGTEMLPALEAALIDTMLGSIPAIRQIVFLTDGDLYNEREMLELIAEKRGRSRIFMVGIGSAPNNFLMRRMAESGRGTFTNVGSGDEVSGKMTAFLDQLAAPVAYDFKVQVKGGSFDLTPGQLPDLYAGEPLVILGRGDALSGEITIEGMIGDKPWSQKITLSEAKDSPAITKLWANRRIAEIEAERWSAEIEDREADEAVEQIGLRYGLVTSRTSLVAVDETPVRPESVGLTVEDLPLLLPAGWDFDTLFGQQPPRTDHPQPLTAPDEQMQTLELPQTASGYAATLAAGLIMLGLGLAGLVLTRRRSSSKC